MVESVEYKLFVEGGGGAGATRIACRTGFADFLKKAGLDGKMPKIVASGSRTAARDDFCKALKNGENAFLLVDSEELVSTKHEQKPWQYLLENPKDGWAQPPGSTDEQCHLMVVCMESWFLADRGALASFFGQNFNVNALPAVERELEGISKEGVFKSLSDATRNCESKGHYKKGEHSFKLLARIDPHKVIAASPWAKRFIDELKKELFAAL